MTEQRKMELKRSLREEITKRKESNEQLDEENAQRIVELITKVINELNGFPEDYVPALIFSWTEGKFSLSKKNEELLGALGQMNLMDSQQCSKNCWEKIKEFLGETLGKQDAETSYVINLLKEN